MFVIALKNVIMTLLYIVPGFGLAKVKKAMPNHLSTISNLLVYILSPSMILSSFLTIEYSVDTLIKMGIFFILTIALQGLFFLITYLVLKKKFSDTKYKMFTIASFLGNVGFFGLPIVRVLFPSDPIVMCYAVIYSITMNLYVFTFVVFFLTGEKKYVSLKTLFINPSMITLAVSLPLFIFKVNQYVPVEILNLLDLFSRMTTPLCMIILGVRLAQIPFKVLFSNLWAYFMAGGKLILYPLFCFVVVYFLPLDLVTKACVLVLASCPCGAIILNMAEIYHKEESICANAVLLSTLFSFITLPIITLLVQLF